MTTHYFEQFEDTPDWVFQACNGRVFETRKVPPTKSRQDVDCQLCKETYTFRTARRKENE